ncbi:hypothetical protein SLS56_011860 [Neofusicoccum ribis]|uniref:Uncharacterized protein n=1 Tax=Neofusicoccum ribis TaxID=45134 RepID=A0ABR3SB23_9PEZI
MPCSGYTVEGQVTKEEKIGGLQIEITPRVLDKVYSDARFSVPDIPSLSIHETCHSKEISIGTRIVMEWDHRPRKPKVADLVNEIQDQTNDDEINLSAWYDEAISFSDTSYSSKSINSRNG